MKAGSSPKPTCRAISPSTASSASKNWSARMRNGSRAATVSAVMSRGAAQRTRCRCKGNLARPVYVSCLEMYPSSGRSGVRMAMVRKALLLLVLAVLVCGRGFAEERHAMTGVVLKVDAATLTMTVSTEKVPGFMEAMAMPFAVRQQAMLNGLKPGTTIDFTFVVDKGSSHAENIRVRGFESLEQKPLELRRLKFLNGLAAPESRAGVLTTRQRVPDFVLTDQDRQRVAFSALGGKVVAVTF